MSETSHDTLRKILIFAAVVEVGTGLVLMIDPAIVVRLLLGVDASGVGTLVGRCFGIALLALGLACWPGPADGAPAFRAMLTYNAFIALYLAYLGTIEKMAGMLLWPGVALHAVVALLLLRAWRLEKTDLIRSAAWRRPTRPRQLNARKAMKFGTSLFVSLVLALSSVNGATAQARQLNGTGHLRQRLRQAPISIC